MNVHIFYIHFNKIDLMQFIIYIIIVARIKIITYLAMEGAIFFYDDIYDMYIYFYSDWFLPMRRIFLSSSIFRFIEIYNSLKTNHFFAVTTPD